MAETLTSNYSWTKPDPGASASTWGTTLNSTIDKVDAQVFTNAQAGVPIGTIMMWAGSAAPAGWLLCLGQSLATTGTYAALFGVCSYTFGGSGANFNIPSLGSRFPLGAGGTTLWGSTGGEATHTLTTAEMPVHTHTFNQAAHAHNNPQTPHAHAISDPGHAHAVIDPGHTHSASETAHSHGIPDTVLLGPGSGAAAGSGAVIQAGRRTDTQQPGVTINAATTGIGATDVRATNVAVVPINANIGATDAQLINANIANAGSGAAHNNLPPYLQINFIIRAT